MQIYLLIRLGRKHMFLSSESDAIRLPKNWKEFTFWMNEIVLEVEKL